MKNWKNYKIWSIMVIAVFITIGCGGGRSLNGTWTSNDNPDNIKITFSGKSFTFTQYGHEMKGIYSILNENIELIFDGVEEKQSLTFSRSGNAITIDNEQYTRIASKKEITKQSNSNVRWEYNSILYSLQEANRLGQEGWELVTVHGGPDVSNTRSPWIMTFKRRLP